MKGRTSQKDKELGRGGRDWQPKGVESDEELDLRILVVDRVHHGWLEASPRHQVLPLERERQIRLTLADLKIKRPFVQAASHCSSRKPFLPVSTEA